jgi:hypothetical protein
MCLKIVTSAMTLIVTTPFILWLIRAIEATSIRPLTASHSFKGGHLADDISLAQLWATVDLSMMLRSVTKAEATLAKLQQQSYLPQPSSLGDLMPCSLQPLALRSSTTSCLPGPTVHGVDWQGPPQWTSPPKLSSMLNPSAEMLKM